MSAARRPSGLHAALGFFTIIPVPAFTSVDQVVAGRAIRSFGLVGLLLGAVAAAVAWGALALGAHSLLAVVLALALIALLTGGLHLDGVADTADGIGSRKPAAEALALMKKSDIGPMGVAALLFAVLLQVAALTQLAATPWWLVFALVTGPMWGRVMLLEATAPGVPMAPTSSFGQLFAGVTSKWVFIVGMPLVALVMSLPVWWHAGPWPSTFILLAATVVVQAARAWRGFLVRRFGGLSGDMFGCLIEGSCTLWWVLLALLQPIALSGRLFG